MSDTPAASAPRPVRCLSVHATYRCHRSGACCSSGWAIPIEVNLYRRLADAMHEGALPRPNGSPVVIDERRDLPSDMAGVLRTRADGTCVFFDRSSTRCEIQQHKGHDALPLSCQQFPRVSLLDARGIGVTLSHYCPTAASLLFDDTPIAIVSNPPAFPADARYDGLDARDAFPPLLRPGVLLDWETLAAWDRFAFDRLDRERRSVDVALLDLRGACEHLREWEPGEGALVERLESYLRCRPDGSRGEPIEWREVIELDRGVHRANVTALDPASATAPDLSIDVDDLRSAWARFVEPVWPTFTRPLCRYVAAKLFASWCWYQGDGLRTVLRSLDAAVAVVRVEAARQARRHGRMLDRDLLRDSIRQADLRLVHLASPEALARDWSAIERAPERGD